MVFPSVNWLNDFSVKVIIEVPNGENKTIPLRQLVEQWQANNFSSFYTPDFDSPNKTKDFSGFELEELSINSEPFLFDDSDSAELLEYNSPKLLDLIKDLIKNISIKFSPDSYTIDLSDATYNQPFEAGANLIQLANFYALYYQVQIANAEIFLGLPLKSLTKFDAYRVFKILSAIYGQTSNQNSEQNINLNKLEIGIKKSTPNLPDPLFDLSIKTSIAPVSAESRDGVGGNSSNINSSIQDLTEPILVLIGTTFPELSGTPLSTKYDSFGGLPPEVKLNQQKLLLELSKSNLLHFPKLIENSNFLIELLDYASKYHLASIIDSSNFVPEALTKLEYFFSYTNERILAVVEVDDLEKLKLQLADLTQKYQVASEDVKIDVISDHVVQGLNYFKIDNWIDLKVNELGNFF